MPIIPLILAIVAGSVGNILIKVGTKGLPDNPLAFLSSPVALLGIALLVASFPFYAQVLQKLPLSIAFPLVTSTTFILVVLISYFFLKEPLTLANIFGILLVIAGLFLASQR